MDHLYEKTIGKKLIHKGRVIDLYIEEVELPNGKTGQREVVKHPGAVAVIAVTDEGKLILVQQYRKALDRVLVEIPAGKLERGEDPREAAHRELEEETGYICEKLELVTSFYTSPGFADEIVHVYIAETLKKKENSAGLDEDEFVDLIELTLEEALEYMEQKKIYDAKTAFAVQFLQLKKVLGD